MPAPLLQLLLLHQIYTSPFVELMYRLYQCVVYLPSGLLNNRSIYKCTPPTICCGRVLAPVAVVDV